MIGFDRTAMATLAHRLLSTLPTGRTHVRFVSKEKAGVVTTHFFSGRGGVLFRETPSDLPPGATLLQAASRRLYAIDSPDSPEGRDVYFPLLHCGLLMGWIGVPLPHATYWGIYARDRWRKWITDFSRREGIRRFGLEIEGTILPRRAFFSLASRLSDMGESFGIVAVLPRRPEMSEAHADIFQEVVRSGDVVGVSDAQAMALCIRGGAQGIATRLESTFQDLVETDWRLSGEMRIGYCPGGGRVENTAIHPLLPQGKTVGEKKIPSLYGTFRRIGLV